jgi:hypothetical protein
MNEALQRQIAVDRRAQLRAPRHRADQQRRVQALAQKRRGQIDILEPHFGQGIVRPVHPFKTGGFGRVLHRVLEADLDVLELAGADAGHVCDSINERSTRPERDCRLESAITKSSPPSEST